MRRVLFWFVGLVAVGLSGFGVLMFVSGRGLIGRVERMEQAELVRMPVDLSRPGRYQGALEHRYNVPHHNPITFIVETPGSGLTPADNVLCGLKAEMTIRTPAGSEREPLELGARDFLHAPELVQHRPSIACALGDPGTYGFALEVKTGAAALAGHTQELVAKYSVCRLEVMVGRVLETLAIVCWILAGIILLVLRHFHKKRQPALARSATSADQETVS